MKTKTLTLVFFVLSLTHVFAQGFKSPVAGSVPQGIRFIENKNQWQPWILYRGGFPGGDILLTEKGFVYYLTNPEDEVKMHLHGMGKFTVHGHSFTVEFENANAHPQTSADGKYADYNNYFLGNNPKYWAGNVGIFKTVNYQNLYTGVDMKVAADGFNMIYDLLVSPGADVEQIKLNYKGQEKLSLKNGNLIVETSVGTVMEEKPFAYQIINGVQVNIPCKYVIEGNTVHYFFPKGYDKTKQLVIDPNLVFSTYTGSTADNFGYTATYDAQGDLYLGGYVNCYNFSQQIVYNYPTTPGAFDLTWNGGTGYQNGTGQGIGYACDMGITKFNPLGTALIYSTYLGGSNNDTPASLFVNSAGELVVLGRSYSNNYPVTAGAFQGTKVDTTEADIVVTHFNLAGSALLGSTYVGGSGNDGVNNNAQEFAGTNLKFNYADDGRGEVICDGANNIYVAQCTYSVDFPVTAGAFQTVIGGALDGVVFKLNGACSAMLYSTYVGGTNDDACYSLDLSGGTVYSCGGTMSLDFPTTGNGWNPAYIGGFADGFVVHLNATGTVLLNSTFVGTSAKDQNYFVKLDNSGNVYFMGQTFGAYPVINAIYSNANSGQFITKLDPTLTTVAYSTIFGNGASQPNISPTAFLVDTCENVYVCGWGGQLVGGLPFSPLPMLNMPLTANAYQSTTDGKDFYLFVMKKNALSLIYGTYFGGTGAVGDHVDGGTSRFDKNGIVYEAVCAGCGGNSSVPTTAGVWSQTNNSTNCNELGFKMSISLFQVTANAIANPAATGCAPLVVNFVNNSQNATNYFWNFGDPNSGAQDSSSLFQPGHTFNDTGHYQIMLVAWDPNSCGPPDTAYTTVVVFNNFITASYTTNIVDMCDSIVCSFTSTSSGTSTQYSWNFGDSTFSTQANPNHTYSVPGTYIVTMIAFDSTACNALDTFITNISFTSKVVAAIFDTLYEGCAAFTVPFQFSGFATATGTYFWTFGDGANSTAQNPTHTYPTAGTYQVILITHDTSTCNKYDTAFATVIVDPGPPIANFTAYPTTVTLSTPIDFTNLSVGATHYYWYFGDGDTSTQVNPSHVYQASGDYNACLTAYNNGPCPDTACITLRIRLIPIIDVPNAFSPNGDGINDVAFCEGQNVSNMTWRIFNRWGEKVYESHELTDGWNGIYKGKQQDMDVYTWTLVATFFTGDTVQKSGNLTLLR